MKPFLVTLIIITSVFIFGCSKNRVEDKTQSEGFTQTKSTAADKAPDFTIPSVDSKTIKLSDYTGKVVIVDFWATWCPPCRKSIPDLIEMQKQYGNDLVIIGISVDSDTKNDVVPFIKQNNINYPVGYATSEVVQAYGGIESIPTSFVIDKTGKIVDQHVGLVPKEAFTSVIDKLIKQ